MAKLQQPPTPKHVPERTCVGCRKTRPKRELVRVVRTPAGSIEVDATGKKAGRGAYLCRDRGCWEAVLKRGRLEHALRAQSSAEDRLLLAEYLRTLPQAAPVKHSTPAGGERSG